MGERRTGTRERIQAVAVELFAEHGYDKTSLRQIAERLDVTKAALYYHFNTKEEIVVSLFEDLIAGLDSIIDWAVREPRTLETRQELVRRYAYLARARPKGMMRFIQESKTTLHELAIGEQVHSRFRTLAGMLAEPDASPTERLKATVALITAGASAFMLKDVDATDEEKYAAGLELALELVSGGRTPAADELTPQSTAR